MSVADKLLQVNQVKQDIKTAIEAKGVPLTNVAFTEYANKILDISGGGGVVDEYFYYAKAYYTITNNATLFSNAWQDMKDSETVLFDIPLELAVPNFEMLEADLYVGTDGQLQALYDACVNETIPPPIDSETRDVYYINNVASFYNGGEFPLYSFGEFFIGDLTPFEMGVGLVLGKEVNVSIPNNRVVIRQGFKFENENGIIIPNSVTDIGDSAFSNWTSNNQPLVIPESVTSIEDSAFSNWTSNNQPLVIPESVTSIGGVAFVNWSSNNQLLVIPDSVTSIGSAAFNNWASNNQPLVIPDSVTSIGDGAFRNWELVQYVEIQAITPPTLASLGAFDGQGNAPIYVPDESVDDYKTATNWINLASRIFSINDK